MNRREHMNEQRLLRKIKNHDHDALDTIIRQYYPSVYAYCRKRCGNEEEAKDITQEVLIRFIQNLDHYEEQGKLASYFIRIAMNLCNNAYAKNKKHENIFMEEEQFWKEEDSLHDVVLRKFHYDYVKKVMKNLKKEKQMILQMYYFEQFTFEEISQILAIPVSTIKSRHKSALKEMKQYLEGGREYESD